MKMKMTRFINPPHRLFFIFIFLLLSCLLSTSVTGELNETSSEVKENYSIVHVGDQDFSISTAEGVNETPLDAIKIGEDGALSSQVSPDIASLTPSGLENSIVFSGTVSILSVGFPGTDQNSPAVWEDRVVWADCREYNQESGYYPSDIYYYNLTTGEEVRITSTAYDELMPDIFGDLIVWQVRAWDDDSSEIHLFNLSTFEETILTDDYVNQVKPQIWGNWIVWQEGDDWEEEWVVYLYDITNNTGRQLGGPYAMSPSIFEDKVVWQDGRNGVDFDIYLYNITLDQEIQITENPAYQMYPSVWGNLIVWEDLRFNFSQIFLYDITTANETQITAGDVLHERPVISGKNVAYINQSEFFDISLIDLDNSRQEIVSKDPDGTTQMDPDLWGERVVWTDGRNGDNDIYIYTIGSPLPDLKADFRENITQGKSPLTVAFNDTSEGQTEGWSWNFGDGNFSKEQNPIHVFMNEGSYSVILIVHNSIQRSAIVKNDQISVGSEPIPHFSSNITSGPAPLSVQFTDESMGFPTGWKWEFGDGGSSESQNPAYVYSSPGSYTVNLTVTNVFGTTSLEKRDFVSVMNGTYGKSNFSIEGIEIVSDGGSKTLIITKPFIEYCIFNPEINASEITCFPPEDFGISRMVFSSSTGCQFSYSGNDTITGNFSAVRVYSCNFISQNFIQVPGETCMYNFSLTIPDYYPDGSIQTVAWEGSSPADLILYEHVKTLYDYAIIEGIAYTVRFNEEKLNSTGPAILVFGIDSKWIEQYGWGDHRALEITSNPTGAMVYVDDQFKGISPIIVNDLSPGPHKIRLYKSNYEDYEYTEVIRDERDSIHVIRISDDGTGEVLNTTFIGHDPVRNLDYFRAESPNGLSTFGVASLSKSGNIFQFIQLAIIKIINSTRAVVHSSPGGSPSPPPPDTASPTPVTPGTLTPLPTKTIVSPVSPKPTEGPTVRTTHPGPTETTIPPPEQPVPPDWPSFMELIKNLSIIFVVIFVTIVFYYRWKKKEE